MDVHVQPAVAEMGWELDMALRGDLEPWKKRVKGAHLRSMRGALVEVGAWGKDLFRADIRKGGLGNRVANATRGKIFPKQGLALNPVFWITTNAKKLIDAFDRGALIVANGGAAVAVAIPDSPAEALPNPKGPDDAVDEARRRFGELDYVPARGSRPAMLVAPLAGFTKTGRLTRRKLTKTGKLRSGTVSVPLFWLFPQVRLKKRNNWRRIRARFGSEAPQRLASAYLQRMQGENI